MTVISFFREESIWDRIFSPFRKLIGVFTEPIFKMVIILCISLIIIFFIVKPKVRVGV